MDALEYKILAKRQGLRDLLQYAMRQSPVYLPIIGSLKYEISVCDCALRQLSFRRTQVRLG